MTQPVVGVLALQGGVAEHLAILASLGARAVRVRSASDVVGDRGAPVIDALVLPGGESSTMDRLCRTFGLFDPLRQVIAAGLPVLGTCAGLIMLATHIEDPAPGQQSLGVLDVTVTRNAFGSQVDSAEVSLEWAGSRAPSGRSEPCDDAAANPFGPAADAVTAPSDAVRAAFIRAPAVTRVGNRVAVLARYRDAVVAVRQDNILGISFHPELTGDTTVHEELLGLVRTRRSAEASAA
ncbi:pyridoxal 5'-phosphate synthase glutaminase subunit PdxT [Kocuria sp. cx-455]|uniref:pyridoxal 5'-phosphate synthase glutaminase subunit PdxT n=1 Tax=Kocuria sp. cx-455 TaxID=2771377 RepID=UPI00168911E0|nr:pyridoxal 5'-phosphate synthase glutaminase subunit PdxT [Kocuria sp. cx-455]MBD2763795.1 pyridoxal 5'-phosphate synthase glutaminase subunit PdxT [Kocuria sp. cx-455]